MKTPHLAALLLLVPAIPSIRAAEDAAMFTAHRVPDAVAVPATANRDYRLLTPQAKNGAKLPLVIYLHGSGAKGDDNVKPATETLPRLLATPAMRKRFPCFVLVPQCRAGDDALGLPNNWVKWENQKGTQPAQWLVSEREPGDQLRAAMAALDDVLAHHPVDTTRVYLTGVSMGGSAAWWWAGHEPEKFAAVITACGLSETGKAASLAKVPLWAFHGSDDPIAPVQRSRDMVAAVKTAGGAPMFTEYTGAGHGIAERVFAEKDHAVLVWLLEQRRVK